MWKTLFRSPISLYTMPSDASVYGGTVMAMALGLIALVYGMEVSGGQSMNAPSIAGGVIILLALGVMVLRIANAEPAE